MVRDNSGASQGKNDKRALAPVRHGIYCDPSKVKLDGRSFFARKRRKLRDSFLEGFDSQPSPRIQAMADGAAVNWILLESLRAAFLRGETLAPSVLKDYTALSNALARDLTTLEALAKMERADARTPTLSEYVASLKKNKLVLAEPSTEPETEPEQKRAGGKASLF